MFVDMNGKRRGFTIVEIIIVIAIGLVLVSIAITRWDGTPGAIRARSEMTGTVDAMVKDFPSATSDDFRFSAWLRDMSKISISTAGMVSGKGLFSTEGSTVTALSPQGEMRCEYQAIQYNMAIMVIGRCDQDHDGGYMVIIKTSNLTCTKDPVATTLDIGMYDKNGSTTFSAIDELMKSDKVDMCDIRTRLWDASRAGVPADYTPY